MLLIPGDPGASVLGYDLPRLHAALNDFPAALLVAAVLFDLVALLARRDSLRTAGFWCLVAGTAGAGLAVVSGLLAEDLIPHGGAAHEIMEEHERLGLITLALFAAALAWRLTRERRWTLGERALHLGFTLIATVVLVSAAQHGGDLVFEHAGGIRTEVLEQELQTRAAGHEHRE